jgi:hypothetical protein
MTPAEFLALNRSNAQPANARRYRAMAEGGSNAEAFLTLHMSDGKSHSLAYGQLNLITGDERGGTLIRLMFRTTTVLRGQQLQTVCEAILAKRAAHLYEFDGGKYDLPEPGAPVIKEIVFEMPQARAANG